VLFSLDVLDGLAGQMNDVVRTGTTDPAVFEPAFGIIRPLPEKKYGMEIRELYRYASKLKRPRTGVGGTRVAPVRDVLRHGAKDAASLASALASMLLSCGHGPVQFAFSQARGDAGLSHVYLRVKHGGRWVVLDPWSGRQAGWEPSASRVQFYEHDREGAPVKK
jgi:hypothetical protein